MTIPPRHVAEISYTRGNCFHPRPRLMATLDVLDEASAAARVLADTEAVLWLDLASQAVLLTERWDDGAVHRRVPVKILVNRREAAACEVDEEVLVATVTCADRAAAELLGRLALAALPEWLSLRRGAAGRSLLILADHWLWSEEAQALKLQHPDGHLHMSLRLDVSQGSIETQLVARGRANRCYHVSCLDDVAKLFLKHSKPQQRLDKVVHTALQELQPTEGSVSRLLERLEAAVTHRKGAPSMAQWCRGGVIAGLVDCAAGLSDSAKEGSSSTSQQRQCLGGCSTHQQHSSYSLPSATLSQPVGTGSVVTRIATLQALTECCALVLQLQAEGGQQAELLVACMCRALGASMDRAVCALQLLHMLLKHTSLLNNPVVSAQLVQACYGMRLLQQLQHCYSSAMPYQDQPRPTVHAGTLYSHQLEGLTADGASQPCTPTGGHRAAGSPAIPAEQLPVPDSGMCLAPPPVTPESRACTVASRRSCVPKLHLPVQVSPAPGSVSHLQVSAQELGSSSHSGAEQAMASGRGVAATSFLRALQQLGYGCGQSAMASDLAAFVTHKQLLGAVGPLEAALDHSKPQLASCQPGNVTASASGQGKLSHEQLARLPVPAQLQVQLLEVLHELTEAAPSELALPRSWELMLLAPLLAPQSSWLKQQGGDVSNKALTEQVFTRVWTLTFELVKRARWHTVTAAYSMMGGVGVGLHHPVLEQVRLQLASASAVSHQDGSVHDVCRQLLLLLKEYMCASQQQGLADTACFMLGGVLAQQEHMLRATRLGHWPWEAVRHMDALVQVYAQLVEQVTTPEAATWLLGLLGVRPSHGTAGDVSCTEDCRTVEPQLPAPADTLQLVLDFLQTHLVAVAAAVDGVCSTGATGHNAVEGPGSADTRGIELLASPLVAPQHSGSVLGTGVQVMAVKAHCWGLLRRLLVLASRHFVSMIPEPVLATRGHRSVSINSCTGSALQRAAEGVGSREPEVMAPSQNTAGLPWLTTPQTVVPLLACPGSSFSRAGTAAAACPADVAGCERRSCTGWAWGRPPAHSRVAPGGHAPGRCSVWQLLVELLMVNSSMGQATAVQHLAETHHNRLLPALQDEVGAFLSTALGLPESYASSKPQLVEFYVHHHFLHFTQHYHKLPAASTSGSAVLCKTHLKVLLALCHQAGGANQVRRRFMQLQVLEFLAREASLEYMCLHNQLAPSPGSSSCSTPQSSSRAGNRASGRGCTDPGLGPGASAASPGLPPLKLWSLLASSGTGPSCQGSARAGGASSRLWSSSPGCQSSARSRQSTQHGWSSRATAGFIEAAALCQQPPAAAALRGPHSFELDRVSRECRGKPLMETARLTGLSGLCADRDAEAGGGSSNSRLGGGAAPLAPSAAQQHQLLPRLGSRVQAAVQALESAAAAVVPAGQLAPHPPSAAAPPAAGGRRQPGHMRLVVNTADCTVAGPVAAAGAPAGVAAAGSGPGGAATTAAGSASWGAGQHQQNQQDSNQPQPWQQAQRPTCSSMRGMGGPAAASQMSMPSPLAGVDDLAPCTASDGPARHSNHAARQPGETQPAAPAPAAASAAASRHGSCSSFGGAVSPRADIVGYHAPPSMLSQRRVRQPDLTGDASFDNIIIDDWERETGLHFHFDGLSQDGEADEGSGSGSTTSTTSRSSLSGSRTGQLAAGSRPKLLRPQTPEVAGQPRSQAALGRLWCVPLVQVPARADRWLSSSSSVEEATAVDLAQALGQPNPGVCTDETAAAACAVHKDRGGCGPSVPGQAAAAGSVAALPQLDMSGLQTPAGTACQRGSSHGPVPAGEAAAAVVGTDGGRVGTPSGSPLCPGSYQPGFDLEEDFERLLAAGDWSDSGGFSDSDTEPSSSSHSRGAAAWHEQQQQQSWQQPLSLAHQPPQQGWPPAPAAVVPSDTEAPTDVHPPRSRPPGKKQAVMGTAGKAIIGLQAHALADVLGSGGSSSSSLAKEEGCYCSSGSDVETQSEDDSVSAEAPRALPSHVMVVPRLNLPQLQEPTWQLPMSALALTPGDSSCTELSSSTRTATTVSRTSAGASLAVMPLTTSRPGCVANSTGSFMHTQAGHSPHSPLARAACAHDCAGQALQPGSAVLGAAVQPDKGPCSPAAATAWGASVGLYGAHRAKCGLYTDPELHVLCLELALHLLVTPTGQLDGLQLPHEPADVSLQRKVLVLLEHLSHPANLDMACLLAQRACSKLTQWEAQQQSPLPISQYAFGQQQQQATRQHSACPSNVGTGSCAAVDVAGHRWAGATPLQQLRSACQAVWDAGPCINASSSGRDNTSNHSGSLGCSKVVTAAAAAAGLACSTLRLLKLLCLPVLDLSSLAVGSLLNKGAFSEVMTGTLHQASAGASLPVVLKVMDCTEDDASSFERVYNEVTSLEALRGHPAVVPLLDYGVTSSISGVRQWVLVFPRYAGSMRDWRLRWRGKGLDLQDLPVYLGLFLQVVQAVDVLHTSNIVHFDIKGDNVLLKHGFDPASAVPGSSTASTPPVASGTWPSSSNVVLADFGDALVLDHPAASSQRHRGTELFSSPEMLLLHAGRQHAQHAQHDRRKHRGIDAAHDVWSLGCTLYELLTGTVLFEDEGVGRITSYSSSQSSGGGVRPLRPEARGWEVLNAREKAVLQDHSGCIELVESMLVGEPNRRPTAAQVALKTERLLACVTSSDALAGGVCSSSS